MDVVVAAIVDDAEPDMLSGVKAVVGMIDDGADNELSVVVKELCRVIALDMVSTDDK